MSEIIPGLLYQCGIHELAQVAQKVQPRAIVNLSGRERAFSRQVETYLCWPFADEETLPDLRILEGVVALVHGLVADRRPVIVHCNAGLNRSGLVVSQVVMRHYKMSGREAVAWVQKRRQFALCNETYRKHVESLEPAREAAP